MSAVTSLDFSRVASDLDLKWRLSQVPANAKTRGIFLSMLRDELQRRRLLGLATGHPVFDKPHRSYEMCSTRDFVEMYGIAAALITAPSASEAVRELFTSCATYYPSTWFGKAFTRYLRPDPMAALRWIDRSREHVANYGRWRLEVRGPEHAVFHMFDEYVWIESAQRGGCEGLLAACGVKGEVRAELDSPFVGRLIVRWDPRS